MPNHNFATMHMPESKIVPIAYELGLMNPMARSKGSMGEGKMLSSQRWWRWRTRDTNIWDVVMED